MKHVYQCETCKSVHDMGCSIFECLGCEKEICDSCFDDRGHCKACVKSKPLESIAKAWEEAWNQ